MKVFLSWSGQYSNEVSCCFERWMPCVLQSIETFISSGDIKAGERWQNRINNALNDIDFGVVFISETNKDKPWIMFETGALAKNLGISRVVPVLCDSAEINFVGSPLLQFQYVKLDRDGVFSLMESLRESLTSEDAIVDRANFERIFDVWWPSLESELSKVEKGSATTKAKGGNQNERLDRIEIALSEILRSSQRTQNSFQSSSSVISSNLSVDDILDGRWMEKELKRGMIRYPALRLLKSAKNLRELENAITFCKAVKSPATLEKIQEYIAERRNELKNDAK